jgi:phenylalanyl-tRNA synthetase beta chain
MKFPLKWIADFVDIDGVHQDELAEKLTLSGVEVESVQKVGKFCESYKVVEVLEVKKIEGIRLPVCVIYDGEGKYEVVSGAPNVKPGKFLWCPPGAKVEKDQEVVEIGLKKIKNLVSYGMLLSPAELGFPGGEEDKLLELPDDVEVGRKASEIFDLPDFVFDISVTPNRGDLLSIIGVAREISAILGRNFQFLYSLPQDIFYDFEKLLESFLSQNEGKKVEIISYVDGSRCFIYAALIFEGDLKRYISPPKIISRLYLCGARPINPVVDATNYVLFELGQPTHVFDLDKIQGKISVRTSRDGEKILCLDGKERELTQDDLVISDDRNPVAIAGIIGGENSSHSPSARRILLESAFFAPWSIRRTSKKLGIETESSYRFSRRVDPSMVLLSALRIKKFFEDYGFDFCGFDLYVDSQKFKVKNIELSLDFLNDYLGTNFSFEDVLNTLRKLWIKTEILSDKKIVCFPPLWRNDINIKEDIVEEVARIQGYDKIPLSLPSVPSFFLEDEESISRRRKRESIKHLFSNLGFFEVKTYPFSKSGKIKIANPMDRELAYLSANLWEKIYETIVASLRRGWENVRVFEIDNVFPEHDVEKELLSFGISGYSFPILWNLPKVKADIFDIKGIVEIILPDCSFSKSTEKYRDNFSFSFLIISGGKEVGFLGSIIDKKIGTEILICEIDFSAVPDMFEYFEVGKFYSELPILQRDISFFVPEGKTWDELKTAFFVEGVLDVFVFDVWSEKGRKSFSARFLIKQEKPMSSEEINKILNKIIFNLESMGAEVRAVKQS